MSRKWRNWYQNEVDEEIKEADSKDEVKHNEKSDQLFLKRMMKVAKPTTQLFFSLYLLQVLNILVTCVYVRAL